MTDAPDGTTANDILIEQLNVNMANISAVIEREGQQLFGRANLLSREEITDYTLEFLELFVKLLQADSRIDRRRKEFKALREFFTNFSQQLQLRGGDLSEFVRYVQFLQRVFLENLQEDQRLSFQQTRELLLQLASVFNDITLDVFNVYLEEKERTIEAQQDELRQTSTPITEIWDGGLTLPVIGTLDSSRTMTVMEQLLARIDAADAQSRLRSARATRNAARSAYERAKSLYAQGIVSQQQLEARQREYEVARSQLEQAQTQVGETRITAPFDGRVAEKMVELNENVGPQQAIVTVQDLSRMEVVIDVPEQSRMRRALQSDSLAVVFSMRPDRRVPATLKEITTTADPRTRTYEATLTVRPPDDAGILPGMTARAIVGGGPASGADGAGTIAIPTSAVFSRSGGTASVWAVRDSSTTVARRSVSLGTMRDSTVVITSGLQVGDRIAATGVHQLNDGQSVRPLE